MGSKKMLIGIALLGAALSGTASAAGKASNLRLKLLEMKPVETLYSIDNRYTVVAAESGKDEDLSIALKGLCDGIGGDLTEGVEAPAGRLRITCAGYFEALRLEGKSTGNYTSIFLIKTNKPQPFAYKNRTLPNQDDGPGEPRKSALDGKPSAREDLFQFLHSLCKRRNGTPAFVIPRKYDDFTRLTMVNYSEGFEFIRKDSGKEGWYFSCENGEEKFLVEKSYQYKADSEPRFLFHPGRGLEGIDYVKDSSFLAGIKSRVDEEKKEPSSKFLKEIIRQISASKRGFVATRAGIRYEGAYSYSKDDPSCGTVMVKENRKGEAKTKVFTYRTCGKRTEGDEELTPDEILTMGF